MIHVRFKKLASGDFSAYLDVYKQGKRKAVFLQIRTSRDYGGLFSARKRKSMKVAACDADKVALIREALLKFELDLVRDKFGFEKVVKVDYMTEIEAVVWDKNHDTYRVMLKHLQTYESKHKFSPSLAFIEGFQNYLLDKKLSSTSVRVYVERLKICMAELHRQNKISDNVFERFQVVRADTKEKNWLTSAELQMLADNASLTPTIARAFLFACFTGLRFSDVENLHWENVMGDSLRLVQIKTKRSHHIPLSDTARQILSGMDKKKGKVFDLPNNTTTNAELKRWSNIVLKKSITFHSARHTFITMVIENSGGDIFTASKLAGHTNVSTTQIYAHLNDSKRSQVVNQLPNIQLPDNY